MGLRGPGAKPIKIDAKAPADSLEPLPWEAEGLDRVGRVVAFLESLPITSGTLAGSKMQIRSWQREFLEAVYREEGGRRPIRTAVLSMARKNGKSGLAAGLALCHLAGPEAEARGQVYSAANDRAQAGLIMNEMCAIIAKVPYLEDRLSIRRHAKEIENMADGSIYAALSSDVPGKHGLSPSFVIYDELGQAPKRDLLDALDTAMGARADPLMMVISTQAADDLAPLSQMIDYGLRVQSGDILDPSFHLTLYAAPEDADPWSPEAWALANPALGDFRSLDDVERQAGQAKRMPSKEAAFKNLILNQRVCAEARFLPVSEWKACGGPVDIAALEGQPCWAALDLGATRDLTALVLVFPRPNGEIHVVPYVFLPADGLQEASDRDRVPYNVWRDQGLLTATPGAATDPRWIASRLAQLHARFKIQCLAYDRWRIETFKLALTDEGLDDLELLPFGQGFKDMAPAVDLLERVVAERQLRHGNHPVLTWCMSNTVITSDPSGGRKMDKSRSTGRIDAAVALAMALAVMERRPEEVAWTPMVA
jgi:phage terminase large subunit-like protein